MKIPYLEKRFEKLDVVKFCQIILLIVYLDQLLSKSQEVLLFYNPFKLGYSPLYQQTRRDISVTKCHKEEERSKIDPKCHKFLFNCSLEPRHLRYLHTIL